MIPIILGAVLIYSHFSGQPVPIHFIGGVLIGCGAADVARIFFW